jgi:membrane-associated phospholipid phosphatase
MSVKDMSITKDRVFLKARSTIALITIFLWILTFWIIVASLISKGTVYYLDYEVKWFVRGVANPSVKEFMISIINIIYPFDNYIFLGIFCILLLYLLLKKELWSIIALFLSIGGGEILINIIKKFFHGWNPMLQIRQFPSRHAFYAMIFCGFVMYLGGEIIKSNLLKSLICLLCTSLILLMGIILIVLDLHWFSDVLGGYCAGFSWLLIAILLTKTIRYFWEGEY